MTPHLPDDQGVPVHSFRQDHPDAPRSVFAGRGMFTVERPQDADGLRLDYTLAALSPFTWATLGGGVFQAETPAQLAMALATAGDYTGRAERALVTNLFMDSWPAGWTCMPECYWNADGGKPGEGRSVPRMIYEAKRVLADQWGSVPVVPVIGCYDASDERPGIGVRLTVLDYLPDLTAAMRDHPCIVGYAIWRVETLSGDDVRALT